MAKAIRVKYCDIYSDAAPIIYRVRYDDWGSCFFWALAVEKE